MGTRDVVPVKGKLSRLKYRVFMIMNRGLLVYYIVLKLEETIAKSIGSREIWTKQT